MTSAGRGPRTLTVDVTNISATGLLLLLDDQEVFVAFSDFPWFRDANIAQLTNVLRPSANRLYWPDLDVDLATESLIHPERYSPIGRRRVAPAASVAGTGVRVPPRRRRRRDQ